MKLPVKEVIRALFLNKICDIDYFGTNLFESKLQLTLNLKSKTHFQALQHRFNFF